jgi:cystathionine gamma-synthase
MLSFLVKEKDRNADPNCAISVLKKLDLFKRATSLGGTESLIEHRKSVEGNHGTSPPNLLRVSVGLEDINDLIADMEMALVKSNS